MTSLFKPDPNFDPVDSRYSECVVGDDGRIAPKREELSTSSPALTTTTKGDLT